MNNEQLLEKIGTFLKPLVDGIAHLKTAVEMLKAGQDDIRERVEILETGQHGIEQKLDKKIEDHEERISQLEAADSHSHHATQAWNDRKREQKHMRLGKFSLCLNVKDLQTSRVFYETLGFEVRAGNEADHWLLMTNGEAYIGLMQGMFEKNMLTFIPNQDHNGQQLPTFTDIRAIQEQLKAAGIAFEQEAAQGTGPASFLIRDPDGNPILVDQHVASSQ